MCDAKELIQDDKVYLWKRCAEHGEQRVLLSDDVAYFRLCREVFLKPPEQVEKYNTPFQYGCPYDCGICPDHEQHGCLSVLEITDHCNLRCPTCFASSGPERTTHRSMDQIKRMLDRIVSNEGTADVVQVSGGEPTTHPSFFEILDECRKRPIRHLMVNTNGVRIAREPNSQSRLATYLPGFELYLQFDGLDDAINQSLRGSDLAALRRTALERLNALNLSTTLVVTLKRGVNDDAIGAILGFAATQRCVRGVTLQPVHDSGRNERFDPEVNRLTLSEVRRRVTEQFPTFLRRTSSRSRATPTRSRWRTRSAEAAVTSRPYPRSRATFRRASSSRGGRTPSSTKATAPSSAPRQRTSSRRSRPATVRRGPRRR